DFIVPLAVYGINFQPEAVVPVGTARLRQPRADGDEEQDQEQHRDTDRLEHASLRVCERSPPRFARLLERVGNLDQLSLAVRRADKGDADRQVEYESCRNGDARIARNGRERRAADAEMVAV